METRGVVLGGAMFVFGLLLGAFLTMGGGTGGGSLPPAPTPTTTPWYVCRISPDLDLTHAAFRLEVPTPVGATNARSEVVLNCREN